MILSSACSLIDTTLVALCKSDNIQIYDITSVCVGFMLWALSYPVFASHADIEGDLLLEGTVMPDYVIDGITFGQGQEVLPITITQSTGDVAAVVAASYPDNANNGVALLIAIAGRGCFPETPDPIIVKNATIVASVDDLIDETEFPNAHDFDDDGSPIYKFDIVHCKETLDKYQVIQIRRPNKNAFTVKLEVYGVVQ